MTEPHAEPVSPPVDDETAASLRHDLVNPINLIVGYTDLLLSDLADLGPMPATVRLEAVRDCGFLLLHQIDRTLLVDTDTRSLAAVERLGESLGGPIALLIRLCDDLMALAATGAPASHLAAEPGEFLADLQKIRSAGLRMQELASDLGARSLSDEASPTCKLG